MAESTMTAIIGREAAYSGKAVEWDAAMKSDKRLGTGEIRVWSVSDARGGDAGAVPVFVEFPPS